MPKLPDQPNVLRYDHIYTVGGDTNVSCRTFWSYTGTPPTGADLNAMATTAFTNAGLVFPAMMNVNTVLNRINITDLTTPSSSFGTHAGLVAGTLPDAPQVASASVLVNYDIGRRYRGGKPRNYLPWGSGSHMSSSQTWSTDAITEFTNALTNHFNAIRGSASGGTTVSHQVNISYYSGFKPDVNAITGRTDDKPLVRTTAIPPDQVLGFAINPRVGTQRRRINA